MVASRTFFQVFFRFSLIYVDFFIIQNYFTIFGCYHVYSLDDIAWLVSKYILLVLVYYLLPLYERIVLYVKYYRKIMASIYLTRSVRLTNILPLVMQPLQNPQNKSVFGGSSAREQHTKKHDEKTQQTMTSKNPQAECFIASFLVYSTWLCLIA